MVPLPDPPPPLYLARAAKRINRAMVFLGAACTAVGLRFFADPAALGRTSIGRALPGVWDEAWSACYVIGGLLLMAGIVTRRPRVELPGLTLAAAATVANGAAILVVVGLPRAWSQVPLYVLALWVFDGRIRDLLELPRERRRGRAPDRRPPGRRDERRVLAAAAPAVIAVAAAGPDVTTSLLVALLGGGIVTALVQALLYRPQRRDLETRIASTSARSAGEMLERANAELQRNWRALDQARGEITRLERRVDTLASRCDALERLLTEHGIPLPH